MPSRAQQLHALGQSVWLDFIRRGHLVSGEFDRLVRDEGVLGVTSNPTIFQQAITSSNDYDTDLAELVAQGLEPAQIFDRLAVQDIQMACDRLRGAFDRTGGVDGRVSIEVSPTLAHDTAGTIAEVRRLHRLVSRDNLFVKIPATREGLPAITQGLAEGVSINVTLIFSLSRYQEVIDAHIAGLERRVQSGQPIQSVMSVASFFVSRVDTKVDKAIEARVAALDAGDPARAELESYLGKSAVANARRAYALFRETVATPRFKALAAKGAHVQRPLWASTSTKNPKYPDTLYVDELIGADTVNTMPPQTLEAFNDHGKLEPSIERDLDGARKLFRRLSAQGVPIDALIDELEPEGVAAFAKSYESLLEALTTRRREM